MKKVLKYLLYGIGLILLIVASISIVIFFQYKGIVDAKPNTKLSAYTPGEMGSKVNPFIGTGGYYYVCAMNFPGATVPFGMVRLSPDTKSFIGDHEALNSSGYYYADNRILGFSHTRLSGTGAWDGGHFRVLPLGNTVSDQMLADGLEARFSHANEEAFPGYYGVKLKDSQVLAEMTATVRTGIHRYTFPANSSPHIYLDVSSTLKDKKTEDGMIRILPDNQKMEGYIRTYGSFAGRYGGIKVYFAAEFNKAFDSYRFVKDSQFSTVKDSLRADDLGVVLLFGENTPTLELRLAISYVSQENAWLNLEEETNGKSFEDILSNTQTEWEATLSRVKIQGATPEQEINYYTALYRAFTMPTIFQDVNGQYIGFDQRVHQADSFTYYTDLSLWDTFRNLHPFYTLAAPEVQSDMMNSLVKMSEQGDYLPRWPSGSGYSNSMLGTPADITISEAYQKGIRDFDVQKAYQAMKKTALGSPSKESQFSGRRGIESYLANQYCAADEMSQAVSRTLEYAWADDAIARLATQLGFEEEAALFHKQSQFYKNVWNPETQYFHPRNKDGSFVAQFDPLQLSYTDWDKTYTDDYVEGSALQWRYAVPFDAKGLISLFKSEAFFVQELNEFFEKSNPVLGDWHPGSYYWHGNEPDIYSPYLFNDVGRPDLTQKWVRWLLDTKYRATYDGLDGNDDGGTLSAWYLFSALGFYPQAGSDIYQIGTPLFKKASIQMEKGVLNIEVDNFAPQNIYVKRIWLNGQPLERRFFKHAEIAKGGTLRFDMQPTPTK